MARTAWHLIISEDSDWDWSISKNKLISTIIMHYEGIWSALYMRVSVELMKDYNQHYNAL